MAGYVLELVKLLASQQLIYGIAFTLMYLLY